MRTSAAIETESGEVILIDASTDLRHQALAHGVSRVDAVLFTHAHADHILGIDDLRIFNFVSRRQIPCFGSQQTLDGIRQTFPYIFNQSSEYEGGLLAQLELHEISHGTPFTVCGIEVLPFRLWHGKMEVFGFRIGTMCYATDCKTIPGSSLELLRGCETLVLDGLRFEEHKTHLTIPEAISIAESLEAPQTYLIHMTHTVDYRSINSALPPRIGLAYDGLSFVV